MGSSWSAQCGARGGQVFGDAGEPGLESERGLVVFDRCAGIVLLEADVAEVGMSAGERGCVLEYPRYAR